MDIEACDEKPKTKRVPNSGSFIKGHNRPGPGKPRTRFKLDLSQKEQATQKLIDAAPEIVDIILSLIRKPDPDIAALRLAAERALPVTSTTTAIYEAKITELEELVVTLEERVAELTELKRVA